MGNIALKLRKKKKKINTECLINTRVILAGSLFLNIIMFSWSFIFIRDVSDDLRYKTHRYRSQQVQILRISWRCNAANCSSWSQIYCQQEICHVLSFDFISWPSLLLHLCLKLLEGRLWIHHVYYTSGLCEGPQRSPDPGSGNPQPWGERTRLRVKDLCLQKPRRKRFLNAHPARWQVSRCSWTKNLRGRLRFYCNFSDSNKEIRKQAGNKRNESAQRGGGGETEWSTAEGRRGNVRRGERGRDVCKRQSLVSCRRY